MFLVLYLEIENKREKKIKTYNDKNKVKFILFFKLFYTLL